MPPEAVGSDSDAASAPHPPAVPPDSPDTHSAEAPTTADDAPDVAPSAEAPASPPQPSSVRNVPTVDVVARILTLEPGCVAIRKDGSRILHLRSNDTHGSANPDMWGYSLMVSDLSEVRPVADIDFGPCHATPEDPTTCAEKLALRLRGEGPIAEAFAKAVGSGAYRACGRTITKKPFNMRQFHPESGATLLVDDLSSDVVVSGGAGGNAETYVVWSKKRDEDDATRTRIHSLSLQGLHEDPVTGTLWLLGELMRLSDADGVESGGWRMLPIPGAAYGRPTCARMSRPDTKTEPLPAPWVPKLPLPKPGSCLAMTPDGKAALFYEREMIGDVMTAHTHWVAHGEPPDLIADAMVDTPKDKEAMKELADEAAALGLVVCPPSNPRIRFGNRTISVVAARGQLWLKSSEAWTWLKPLPPGYPRLTGTHQLPDGPVVIKLSSQSWKEREYHVISRADLHLCDEASD